MLTKKLNNLIGKGLPAKFLLILGIVIFLVLITTFGPRFLPDFAEYKKDQAHLAEVMRGKLPETPVPEVKLLVRGYIIAGGAGYCMVDAAAGIANFYEPGIDFDKFIFFANPTLIMAKRDKNERYGPGLSIMRAFKNFGYIPFRGATTPIHPPQNIVADFEPQNLIYFKDVKEELLFAKKLLSAGIVPIVGLRRDPFEDIEGGVFSSLVGYNKDGVWLNISPQSERYAPGNKYYLDEPIRYEPRFASYDLLMKYWVGEHQLLWAVKSKERKSEAEVYRENKKNVQEAPVTLQKSIEFLKNNSSLLDFTAAYQTPEVAVLYRYFKAKGNLSLANQYKELADTYESVRVSQSKNPKDDRQEMIEVLTTVYPYISKISTLWP